MVPAPPPGPSAAGAATDRPAYQPGDPVLIPAKIHAVGRTDALVTIGNAGPFMVPTTVLVPLATLVAPPRDAEMEAPAERGVQPTEATRP